MASMYAVFHGPEGLKAIAQRIHRKTVRLAKGLESLGFAVEPREFFDTITVEVGSLQGVILKAAVAEGINLRRVGTSRIGIALDERTRREHTQAVWRAFGGDMLDRALDPEYRLPEDLLRTSEYLTHPIFHMNRAEAEITRYMRRLADRDLALDRAMIPLGSCTMKLNATAEMMAPPGPSSPTSTRSCPRPDRGLRRGDRRPLRQALRHHRLRRLLDAAELGRPGRICRAPTIRAYHRHAAKATATSA